MKTVMSGVALAAMLALAMPAWAQGTDAQHPNHPPNALMPHAKKAHATHAHKMSHKNMKHAAQGRSMHRTSASGRGGTGPTDNVANQLNQQEAQRAMTGGSTPPMGNPNMGPAGNPNMAPRGNPNMAPMGAPNPQRPMQGQ